MNDAFSALCSVFVAATALYAAVLMVSASVRHVARW